MRAEISFDLVMEHNMAFVEGTYRLPGKGWEVFIFSPDPGVSKPVITSGARWQSGVTGVHVKWPDAVPLNKLVILQLLSEQLGVTEWDEVRGPDSMMLR